MRAGDLIDATWRAGRRAFVPLAILALLTSLPLVVLMALVAVSVGPDAAALEEDPAALFDADTALALGLTLVLGAIASAIAVLASARVAVAAHEGEEAVRWQDSLRAALPRVGSALWVLLLLGLGLLVGFLLLLLPGIWLAVAWSLAITVLAIEDRRGTQALRRSFQLVRGRWWMTFGTLLAVVLLAGVVSALVQAPFTAAASALGGTDEAGPAGVEALGTLLGTALTSPFVAAVTAVLFVELRRRADGVAPAASAGDGLPAADAFGRPGEAPPGWLPPTAR